jgi:thioredoxin-related protein
VNSDQRRREFRVEIPPLLRIFPAGEFIMKKCLLAVAALLAGVMIFHAELWTEDFDAALTQAKDSGKYVLVNFSGSDWCGWCKKLDKEVFGKKEFADYTEKNLVCVLVDFPRQKPQSDKQKAANNALLEKYGVQGFPTILLFSPQGEVAATTGYEPGGAESYIKHLQGLIDQHKTKP